MVKHLLFKDGDFKKEIKKLSTKRVVKKLANFPISTVDLFDVTEIPVLTETDVAGLSVTKFKQVAKKGVIILVANPPPQVVGHFVCMWQNEGKWHYWDSFGKPITSQILRDKMAGESVYYNTQIYQDIKLNSCGPQTSLRLAFKHLDDKQYYDKIRSLVQEHGLTPDQIAMSLYVLDARD